ncbi:hypothetical protein H6G27_20345 [Nostoc linckia FACHB-104]|nr:hypothetical protein [Nostoc linckia FACHB-104]
MSALLSAIVTTYTATGMIDKTIQNSSSPKGRGYAKESLQGRGNPRTQLSAKFKNGKLVKNFSCGTQAHFKKKMYCEESAARNAASLSQAVGL